MNEQTQDLHPVVATPMRLIELAVEKGADISTIERLVALQEKMLNRDAEIAFNAAMNQAQKAMGRVAVDLENPQTRSKYASYAALDRVVRPIYTEHGFSLSFDTGEAPAEIVRSVCHVSHEAGFTRTYHVDMPADGKGARGGDVMTKTHATGAAMSYGQRYLLKYIFNVAIGEDDTDGNNGELIEAIKKIEAITSIDELQKFFLATVQPYKEAKNSAACNALIEAKDKRKTQLAPKPAQQPQTATVATSKALDDGKMEIDCTILDCRHKQEQKTGGKVTSAGYVRLEFNAPSGTSSITCWHQHLWPALSTAKKGDRGVFIVKEAKGYLNLEDVNTIGSQKFIDGKPVVEGA